MISRHGWKDAVGIESVGSRGPRRVPPFPSWGGYLARVWDLDLLPLWGTNEEHKEVWRKYTEIRDKVRDKVRVRITELVELVLVL